MPRHLSDVLPPACGRIPPVVVYDPLQFMGDCARMQRLLRLMLEWIVERPAHPHQLDLPPLVEAAERLSVLTGKISDGSFRTHIEAMSEACDRGVGLAGIPPL